MGDDGDADGGGPHVQQGNQTQYSSLQGNWTYAITYTLKDATLWDVHAHWSGKIELFSEPQFQVTVTPQLTPPQYAIQGHLLSITWPQIGPFVIQSVIDAQYQWQGSNGQVSVIPGIQLAPKKFDTLSISFGAAAVFGPNASGHYSWNFDAQPSFNAWLTLPVPGFN